MVTKSLASTIVRNIALAPAAVLFASCVSPDRWDVWDKAEPEPQAIKVAPADRTVAPHVAWEPPPLDFDQGSLTLSVEEAVFTALARNRELRIQTLNPIVAGAFETIERGAFRPTVYAGIEGGEEQVSETARATGEQFSVTGEDARGEIGVRQTLPTGTDVDFSVQQGRSISSRTPEQQDVRVGLSVTQSLLRGFGPSVNLAAVRQAKLDTLASIFELRGYTEAFVAEVEVAYWNFVLAREQIAIFERSLELARHQLSEVEGRIEVGALSRSDGAIDRSEVARRESALIDAQAFLEEQRLRLARLLNAQTEFELRYAVEATTEPSVDFEPLDELDARIELALQSRPDLNEAKLRLAQDRLETLVTRNGLLPRLDLFLILGKTGYADTILDSFEDLQEDSYEVTAGLEFSQALGRGVEEGRHLLARANREQSAEAVLNLAQLVTLDVRLAANEVQRARRQIDATAAIRLHLEDTVQSEEERLAVGSSTALQVAQARRDLVASRIQEVEALVYYRIALVELYLAEGSLLERRGIVFPGFST